MKKLKWILLFLLLAGAGGAWYGYSEWTRKHDDITDKKADFELSASDLIKAFTENESEAGKKYNEKICTVTANVISVDKDSKGHNTVMLGSETDFNSVSCQMDSVHNTDADNIKAGEQITIKCLCKGFLSDVILQRCVIPKK